MSVNFLVFLLETCVFGNFNPSEMSKTFIFVKKNAFLFVLFTMIVKNVVTMFGFFSFFIFV